MSRKMYQKKRQDSSYSNREREQISGKSKQDKIKKLIKATSQQLKEQKENSSEVREICIKCMEGELYIDLNGNKKCFICNDKNL